MTVLNTRSTYNSTDMRADVTLIQFNMHPVNTTLPQPDPVSDAYLSVGAAGEVARLGF